MHRATPSALLWRDENPDGRNGRNGTGCQRQRTYFLELSTTPGFPTPGAGAVVRLRGTTFKTIATGLTLPTGMTLGSDGALYVSNFGTGSAPGAGQNRENHLTVSNLKARNVSRSMHAGHSEFFQFSEFLISSILIAPATQRAVCPDTSAKLVAFQTTCYSRRSLTPFTRARPITPMKITQWIAVTCLGFLSVACGAQVSDAVRALKILPAPKEVRMAEGKLVIKPSTTILIADPEDRIAAETLQREIHERTGIKLAIDSVTAAPKTTGHISLGRLTDRGLSAYLESQGVKTETNWAKKVM